MFCCSTDMSPLIKVYHRIAFYRTSSNENSGYSYRAVSKAKCKKLNRHRLVCREKLEGDLYELPHFRLGKTVLVIKMCTEGSICTEVLSDQNLLHARYK